MSLELICINYADTPEDAFKAMNHCIKIFPRFERAVLLHPLCIQDTYGDIELFQCNSETQNECCLYEMPQYITCDHALGIQWDGFIVNPDAWTDEFLEYDLVAPPWPLTNIVNPDWRVGSGGFVLFSKRMCQMWGELCQPHPYPNDWSMGAVDRQKFEDRGIKFAPLELAMKFGEEIPLDDQKPLGYTPFGMHGFQYGNHEKWRKTIYG